MPSDIKLENERVVVEGACALVMCTDLMMDNAGRRAGPGEFRRALVHDYGDKLTLNWGRDYPGGVSILGKVSVPDKLVVGGASIEPAPDGLSIEGKVSAGGGATVHIQDAAGFQAFYDRLLLRHTLGTWTNARALSDHLGLPALRETLEQLCLAWQIPLFPLPQGWYRFVSVSLGEILAQVPEFVTGPAAWPATSLRGVAQSLGIEGTISLRELR